METGSGFTGLAGTDICRICRFDLLFSAAGLDPMMPQWSCKAKNACAAYPDDAYTVGSAA